MILEPNPDIFTYKQDFEHLYEFENNKKLKGMIAFHYEIIVVHINNFEDMYMFQPLGPTWAEAITTHSGCEQHTKVESIELDPSYWDDAVKKDLNLDDLPYFKDLWEKWMLTTFDQFVIGVIAPIIATEYHFYQHLVHGEI